MRARPLPDLWQVQADFDDAGYREELLHDSLEKREPKYGILLAAIRAYEAFARSLQDAFDVLKFAAARPDARGFAVSEIVREADFRRSVKGLDGLFDVAHRALGEVTITSLSIQNLFVDRFKVFGEPMDAGVCAQALCAHHEAIQRGKSADGKRPWFDRIGPDRIYIRHAYREPSREPLPGRYVHGYRGLPIRRFYSDLS